MTAQDPERQRRHSRDPDPDCRTMRLLQGPLLWLLLFMARGDPPNIREISARLGSEVLLPLTIQLTLIPTDGQSCDDVTWIYDGGSGDQPIATRMRCKSFEVHNSPFPTMKISENGSLIISPVTAEHAGRYSVKTINSAGNIMIDNYRLHVEGDPPNIREISAWLGSEALLPVTTQLTLIPTDRWSCDDVTWKYGESGGQLRAERQRCGRNEYYTYPFPNMKISENGSLIISRVTAVHAGRYRVTIYNSARNTMIDYYTLHVEGDSWSDREIYTQPGSEVLLPITIQLTLSPTDIQSCDEVIWKYGESGDQLIAHIKRCRLLDYNRDLFPNIKISENGSLILSSLTAKHAGSYSARIINSTGNIMIDYYRLHVVVPVSVLLDILCLSDGRAQISCRVDKGTHHTMSLYINGYVEERSSSSLTFIMPAPGPWRVSCSAENRVSREENNQTKESCPVSLSGIAMNSSCHRDGRAEAFCRVDKGSDLLFSWSLDGKSQKGESNSSYSRVTLPPPVSGILRCDVTNEISRINHSMNVSCPAPLSVPVISVSCLPNRSAEISCNLEKGTDPSITLTINGTTEEYHKISSHHVRITVPIMTSPSNVTCSVTNSISNHSAIKMLDACPVPDFYQRKVFPVRVFLVIVLPLFLACFQVYHLQENCSKRKKKSRPTPDIPLDFIE